MSTPKRLTHEEFVLLAIETLAEPGRTTIHAVYSNFNRAFRKYFPDDDPVKVVEALTEAKKISSRVCRGGALIALPGVLTPIPKPAQTLKKMGLD